MKLQMEENLKQLAAEFEESLKRLDKGEHAQFAEMIEKLPAPTLNRLIKEWLPFYLKKRFLTKKHYIRPLFHYILKNIAFYSHPSFDVIFSILSSKYPKIHEYFDEQRKALRVPAIELLVQGIKNQPNSLLKEVDCHVCSTVEDFYEKVSQLDLKKERRVEFLVRDASKELSIRESAHMTSIHGRIKDGKAVFIITDSVGNMGLIENFNYRLDPEKKGISTIYSFTGRRQKEITSCPVFAIRDMIEFLKHPELFDEIPAMASPADAEEDVVYFNFLPPYFMKVCQSDKQINDYIGNVKEALRARKEEIERDQEFGGKQNILAAIARRNKELAALEKALAFHRFKEEEEGREKNLYSAQRYYKYEALILLALFEEALRP